MILKRLFDIIASAIGLLVFSPILLPTMFLVWWHDKHSPLYIAPRVGKDGVLFRMVKLRSMVINADKTGVDSTGSNDKRITAVGHFIRRTKLDELTQLWNVLKGDMSLVGPRPNVKRETDLYTAVERGLLTVKPGITDFASLVFADEGDILRDEADPDIAYNQLIRPGKGQLGLFYIQRRSFLVDVYVCVLTATAILSRQRMLERLQSLLASLGAPPELLRLASRREPLVPLPPPGATRIVTQRDGTVSA
jgi:lipopolysaccharide/colanic/teichoic acid biosynthesis glycosyltransferase